MRISDILKWLDSEGIEYRYKGERECTIDGFSSLSNYKLGSLTWIKKEELYDLYGRSQKIRCAIVDNKCNVDFANAIYTDNSKEVFFNTLQYFWSSAKKNACVEMDSFVSLNTVIGESVSIGHNCSINGNIFIGDNTIIEDNVVVMNDVRIGNGVIIHSGVVIGKDGYGFSFDSEKRPKKTEHFGGVSIGNNVEIGGNTIIDRGTIDDTVIGDYTKIDSHCLVAHNSVIGQSVLIVGGVMIGGSVKIGDYSYIAPGSIVKNQISVGKNCFVGMQMVVTKDMPDSTILLPGHEKAIYMADYRRFL